MSKKTSLFLIDSLLLVILIVIILTGGINIFTDSRIHTFFGILLFLGAAIHIGLHWNWIKNAFQRYSNLPDSVCINAKLDMLLFFSYIICGSFGLSARLIQFPFHRHLFLGITHVVMAVLISILQIIHIARHWNWINTTVRKITVFPASFMNNK